MINYDVPNQDMVYFHRIGRTARAGEKGRAITLVSYSSIGDFKAISRQTKVQMIDLNKELGIVVNIPDPLKREVSHRRSFGRSGGGGYGRSGGGYGRSGGGYGRSDDRRDDRRGDRRRTDDKKYYGLRSRW